MKFQLLWNVLVKNKFLKFMRDHGFYTPKHEHTWRYVGYGGAGWYLLRCDECGAEEIV